MATAVQRFLCERKSLFLLGKHFNGIAGLYGKCMFNFIKTVCVVGRIITRKDVLIPRTCEQIRLYGKGELKLQPSAK